MLTRANALRALRVVAAVVYLGDVLHVHRYITHFYDDEEDDRALSAPERARRAEEDARILRAYASDCAPEAVVDRDEFKRVLAEFAAGCEEGESAYKMGSASVKVMRESISFGGAGRAAFLQLAHPFIASGIRVHSALENGVRQRFIRTFKYVFAIAFGTKPEVLAAARAVRSLHDKVKGEIGEDVGVFTARSKFDAAQEDAMRWVAATLLETAVMQYEKFVGLLSEAEKDQMVQEGARFRMLFGVPLRPNELKTWAEFRRYMAAMRRSRVLTVSESAKDTAAFILLPPTPAAKPLMNFVGWITAVQLPPHLAVEFYGRSANWLDRLLYAFAAGLVRFIYRLVPPSGRHITAYLRMRDRFLGPRPLPARLLSLFMARFADHFLDAVMLPRDPDVARAKVKEMRAQQPPVLRIHDSPNKVGAKRGFAGVDAAAASGGAPIPRGA